MQNDKFTASISELIDTNVEDRLAKSKNKTTEKSIELVACLKLKLATFRQQN